MGGRLPHRSLCGPLGLGLFPKVFFAHLLRSEQLRLGLGSVEGVGVGLFLVLTHTPKYGKREISTQNYPFCVLPKIKGYSIGRT